MTDQVQYVAQVGFFWTSVTSMLAAIAGGPTIERAVAAVADAGSRIGQTFASTATAALGITRR